MPPQLSLVSLEVPPYIGAKERLAATAMTAPDDSPVHTPWPLGGLETVLQNSLHEKILPVCGSMLSFRCVGY